MKITILVSVSENGIIGVNNRIPWHLSTDLKRFKRLTMGHTLILGRKTFESIGKPLPGREMLVLSRKPQPAGQEGIQWVKSMQEALKIAEESGEDEVFVVGGVGVYTAALSIADRLLLTRVHTVIDGDTSFPKVNPADWVLINKAKYPAGKADEFPFSFLDFHRKKRR